MNQRAGRPTGAAYGKSAGSYRAGWQYKGETLKPGVDFQPFRLPGCARCGFLLRDQYGQPSWDLIGNDLVCRESCGGRPTVLVPPQRLTYYVQPVRR
jgi:hypothetical protein